MSALDDNPLNYEELPKTKYKIFNKEKRTMSKTTNEVPTAKIRKVYEKTRSEHYKDIIIAVLVTAIVAFGLGMRFQAAHDAEVTKAVASVVVPVKK